MHQAIPDIWFAFNTPLEGDVPRLYADVKGLITCSMGILVDPMPAALAIDWELPGGIPASKDVVARAWRAVKNDPKCAKLGWKYAAGLPENNVRLSPETSRRLVLDKLESNDLRMRIRFPDWNDRPADAQLAIHSMAWAMGPMFFKKFPKFTAAFTRGDYETASDQCAISPAYVTIVERNARNSQLLLNAAHHGPNPEVLLWELPVT